MRNKIFLCVASHPFPGSLTHSLTNVNLSCGIVGDSVLLRELDLPLIFGILILPTVMIVVVHIIAAYHQVTPGNVHTLNYIQYE